MKKVETKYGEVELRVVMTDIDGTNLDDLTIADVEEIVEYFI